MKLKPKSCSCSMCKSGKRTKGGHVEMSADERAIRRATKTALRKVMQGEEVENIPTVPIGNHFD